MIITFTIRFHKIKFVILRAELWRGNALNKRTRWWGVQLLGFAREGQLIRSLLGMYYQRGEDFSTRREYDYQFSIRFLWVLEKEWKRERA